ncbi:hypothetical protein C7S15_8121 [Burkholderia cepacia]|nr:hypothetical protein [Burkholderia cepacia]
MVQNEKSGRFVPADTGAIRRRRGRLAQYFRSKSICTW